MFKKRLKKNDHKKKKVSKTSLKIKELKLKFKRWKEQYKEKKELKRQELNQSIKPKGYVARKAGVAIFWVLFGFMFLVVIVTIFSKDNEANADQMAEVKQNEATAPEATQFANNFLKDYFTWTASEDGNVKRIQALAKYIPENLRGHKAFEVQNLEWNSKFINAQLKDITEKGNNLAYQTFLVDIEVSPKSSKEKDKPEAKRLQKYVQVPIAFDGYSFGVYELPKFTYINEDETTIKEVTVSTRDLNQSDITIVEKIEEFLPTFFKAYAEDEQEKLNYMLKKENIVKSLNGTMQFEAIENLQVFDSKNEDQYLVFTEIRLREPETNLEFFVNHQLELIQEENKFLVSGIDNLDDKGVVSNIEEENDKFILEVEELEITGETPESTDETKK